MSSRPELPLTGCEFDTETSSVAARTCARHLAMLGATPSDRGVAVPGASASIVLSSSDQGAVDALSCEIPWPGVIDARASDRWRETALQATSGLMGVHGLDVGRPRRLGLDVVTNALGILACQALLAGTLARARGVDVETVTVQPPGAAVVVLAHHLAAATCGDDWRPPVGGSAPGPPFATADGHYVELEILDPDRWGTFWSSLGAEAGELGTAWLAFAFRHVTGSCRLPSALHEATRRCSLGELRRSAGACGVSMAVVRAYADVIPEWETGRPPWDLQSLDARGTDTNRNDRRVGEVVDAVAVPLAGIRVIDATSRIQGPLAGRLLAQLGADVVHVEPPGGDPARDSPPTAGSVGAAYLTYNQGKRVVELDYKTPGGRADLMDLIAEADVFVHNWRSGREVALRLTSGDLARAKADLVYAHATGWGDAADAALPGVATDFLVQAHAACGAGLNPEGARPFPSRLTLVDVTGGLVAAEGILAALLARERTGRGCAVNTSLYGSALDMQHSVFDGIARGGESGRRIGRPFWTVLDQPLETADGYVVVDASDDASRRRIARACSLGDADIEAVARALRSKPRAAVLAELRSADVPCEPVRTDLSGLSQDPVFGRVVERLEGSCEVPASPWCFR